jgi:hypothetical protein
MLHCKHVATKRKGNRMDTETNYYHGYQIIMERHGNGWRAMICPPNSTQAIPGPESDDPTSHKSILAEAQRLIDRHAV